MTSHAFSTPPLPPIVGEVLADFHRMHGQDAWLWVRDGSRWVLGASTAPATVADPSVAAAVVQGVDGLEMCVETSAESPDSARFLASVLSRILQHDAEARFFGRELAERYEEITLLYSISEILGTVISLEEATATILSEVAGTLAVQRAALWLFNPDTRRLELIAAVGQSGQTDPIRVEDPYSVTAAVYRNRHAMILEPGDEFPRGAPPPELPRRGSFLSVPVSYTPPNGETRTIGVINLIGRGDGHSFSAGDQKLISAIASQIGAAIENSRLVATSLRQERMVREMELAHDLQLKLLPSVEQFRDHAEVSARCIPADSVGGDFYHLFRLPSGRLGVMIGDVSSHGFAAALIMALTMSAVAIHASEGDSPGEVMRRAHQTLIDELETTEMYLTLFYGVIDPVERRITYANAGHQHAFRIAGTGEVHRLGATNPPFGIIDLDTYREETAEWVPGEDVLCLFTDGLSDAIGAGEVESERLLLDAVVAARHEPTERLLDELFSLAQGPSSAPADDRTAVLVRL